VFCLTGNRTVAEQSTTLVAQCGVFTSKCSDKNSFQGFYLKSKANVSNKGLDPLDPLDPQRVHYLSQNQWIIQKQEAKY